VFGITAWLLAAVGLYAVTTFEAAQRSREMAFRNALGARSGSLIGLVLRDALRPVLIGLGTGLLVAFWSAGLLQAFLHDVDARDPWTYGLVALVLAATAVLAAWPPARRAAQAEPATVLRAT
jgi:ABC-type antimicrobial peptide transport system permease subunit